TFHARLCVICKKLDRGAPLKRRSPRPPYTLPPLPDPHSIPQNLSRRNLWEALEFFRIEALLRSRKIWALYRRAPRLTKGEISQTKTVREMIARQHIPRRGRSSEALCERFCVADGWAILRSSHHRYLSDCVPERFERAIEDFEKAIKGEVLR